MMKLLLLATKTVLLFCLLISLLSVVNVSHAADRFVESAGNNCGGSTPCDATVGAAVSNAAAGDVIKLTGNITEGLVNLSKAITLDGQTHTFNSTSASWGIQVSVPGVSVLNITIDNAGTFGLQVTPGSNNLTVTNLTVSNGGGTGISLNCSNNLNLTNITSTNNGGNGVSITDCSNVTINGVTTSGNTFGTFGAGVGVFASGAFCPPGGSANVAVTGTVNIAEVPALYEQSFGPATISGTSFTPTGGSTGPQNFLVSAGGSFYAPDLPTAFAFVNAFLSPPANTDPDIVYIEEVATGKKYVDDNPAGGTVSMRIQPAVDASGADDEIVLAEGTYSDCVTFSEDMTITVSSGTGIVNCLIMNGSGKALLLGSDLTIRTVSFLNGDLETRGNDLTVSKVEGGPQ